MAKPNPFEKLVVFNFKSRGGKPAGGSTLAQKVGPLGVNAKKLGDDITKKISSSPGVKVHTKISIQNRQHTIEVLPSTTQLLKDILNKNGALTLADVKTVAEKMKHKLAGKKLKGNVLQVLGTCVSIQAHVDGMTAKDMTEQIKTEAITV
eukprot:GAHX01000282.1.p1 GENE.GAHX01000282.1~~GAHX01000282.1.p1  ORF type:complete len:150 (-),score=31.89 GAHX01000282.1:35-484(-)